MASEFNSSYIDIEDIRVTFELQPLEELPDDLKPVLDYWQSLVPENSVGPAWTDFDMMRLPVSYLPTATVVDYTPSTETYRYRYWGSQLTPVFGADLTGKTFEEVPGNFTQVTYQSYGLVAKHKRPCLVKFTATIKGENTTFQTALRLPLSEDGQTVSGFVSLLLVEYKSHEWDPFWT